MVFSSLSYSYSSITNAFLIINNIIISTIGKKISQSVVHLFLFKINKFFFISAFNFDDELPLVEILFSSIMALSFFISINFY